MTNLKGFKKKNIHLGLKASKQKNMFLKGAEYFIASPKFPAVWKFLFCSVSERCRGLHVL